MVSRRRRFHLFGSGCAVAGWATAGFLEFYGIAVGWTMLAFLALMLAVAWAADRLTAPPRPSKNPNREPD